MSTMICSICGMSGIYWKDITKVSPYTYCPNCRNVNCQEPEEEENEEIDDSSDAVTGCGDK